MINSTTVERRGTGLFGATPAVTLTAWATTDPTGLELSVNV
nr:hypothetical protein [Kibdelosporangium sp. MJ126-NF4]CTQ97098.1 hypothetical protein [Kibdelosporangium sp. MJ126-NF4]